MIPNKNTLIAALNGCITVMGLLLCVSLTSCSLDSYTPPCNQSMFADDSPPTINGLYDKLKANFPQYDHLTYSAPQINYLADHWLIQTPHAWGQTIDSYNAGLLPKNTQSINTVFQLPQCQSNVDCAAGRYCVNANFSGNAPLCLSGANLMQQRMYTAIVNAKKFVDITTLQPSSIHQPTLTTDGFTSTLKNAIIALAYQSENSSTPIYVRLLQGSFMPGRKRDRANLIEKLTNNQLKYLEAIVNDLPRGNKLVISIASQRSCALTRPSNCGNEDKQHSLYLSSAWNHGKIIDIDSRTLIVGGENLWGDVYLNKNPVNDANIEIAGPTAQGATTYSDQLWQFVYKHQRQYKSNVCHSYNYQTNEISNACPSNGLMSMTNDAPYNGAGLAVKAMPIAKLNNGVLGKQADQSEFARVYAFGHAKREIQISQQAMIKKIGRDRLIYPLYAINGTVMQALAHAISHSVTVDIVTSNLSPNQSGYSSQVDSQSIYDYLLHLLRANFKLNKSVAAERLKNYLHIKTIAYSNTDPKASQTPSHNKVWIVDRHLFYFGSHNIYPSSLQQFGVIIDSRQATKQLESEWWQPLWRNAVWANYKQVS